MRKLLILMMLPLTSSLTYAITQPKLTVRNVEIISVDGLQFKDMNNDGQLNPYEDWRLTAQQRATDLLSRMSLNEKAGMMVHATAAAVNDNYGSGQLYDLSAIRKLIMDNKVNSFITRLGGKPSNIAEQNNKLQEMAEMTRLAIPLTISTDPRHTYHYTGDAYYSYAHFSVWPSELGIAAINDEEVTRRYADIIRQEYRAIGVTQALSPMADIASEPRWSRISGTFGEDPVRVKRMVQAYITGMQFGHTGLNNQSVSAVVKHWVGNGAAENGFDSYHAYGKYSLIKDDTTLQNHISPFEGAFSVNVAGVMPAHSMFKAFHHLNKKGESVSAGFNHYLLNDLLREKYQFNGVIISDWMIIDDCYGFCLTGYPVNQTPQMGGTPWGVEHLSRLDRIVKAVKVGVDQFGGFSESSLLVQAVQQGLLSESRLNESVLRILQQKFALGQFEDPFVDSQQADYIVGHKSSRIEAEKAQRNSLVLLKKDAGILPLKRRTNVYLYGIEPSAAKKFGLKVVKDVSKANLAIMRVNSPYEPLHKNFFFGSHFHEGSLVFQENNPDLNAFYDIPIEIPVIVVVNLQRAAILTPFVEETSVLLVDFGVNDDVLFSALMDNQPFNATLPIELPSTMKAVFKQRSDLSCDSDNPLFSIGFGLQ